MKSIKEVIFFIQQVTKNINNLNLYFEYEGDTKLIGFRYLIYLPGEIISYKTIFIYPDGKMQVTISKKDFFETEEIIVDIEKKQELFEILNAPEIRSQYAGMITDVLWELKKYVPIYNEYQKNKNLIYY